jgi:hypothetical protein
VRYRNGKFEPLEKIDLVENSELDLMPPADEPSKPRLESPLDALAGAWVGLVDCEQLVSDIYASRSMASERPLPRFDA